jgi:hypothetical protein
VCAKVQGQGVVPLASFLSYTSLDFLKISLKFCFYIELDRG